MLTLLHNIPRESYQLTLGLVYRPGPHLQNIPSDIPVRYLFERGAKGTTKLICTDAEGLYQKIAPPDSDIEIALLEGNATKILSKSRNIKAKKAAWIHIDLNRYHHTARSITVMQKKYWPIRPLTALCLFRKAVKLDLRLGLDRCCGSVPLFSITLIDVQEIIRMSKAFPVSKRRLTCCASGRRVLEKDFSDF